MRESDLQGKHQHGGPRCLTFSGVSKNSSWLALVATVLMAWPASVQATATLVVDTTEDYDSPDARWGDTSTIAALLGDKGSDNAICLREAITACNNTTNSGGPDEIHFDVTWAGPHTIQPASALPTITDPVVIDGTSEPDFGGTPIVELDGSAAGAGVDGLRLNGGNCTVRALVINRFDSDGILINGSGGNVTVGNYIGTDVTGMLDRGNSGDGIDIQSDGNIVGGTTVAERNIIAGNSDDGLDIDGVDGNIIIGNYIGTNADGSAAIPNTGQGVLVKNGSTNTRVGGPLAGERNVVSGNADSGVQLKGAGTQLNEVLGNYIGTDAAGTGDLGNGTDGIVIRDGAQNNVIGGLTAAERNILSGNDNDGIWLTGSGTSANTVQGNWIGFGADGSDLGNSYHGIGIEWDASGNLIGGTAAGAGNRIGNSSWDGITVASGILAGNRILGNSIVSSGDLGIDLNDDGVTGNDPDDDDGGPNQLQNYPVLTSAVTNAATVITIDGNLDSAPSTTFRVEFFASTTADPSGYGEGETHLGYADVNTDSSGDASFSVPLAKNVPVAAMITATASDAAGNTSEFSEAITAVAGDVLVVDTTDDYDAPDGRWGDASSIASLLADKGSDGSICLREAITACNNTANGAGPDEIHFSIDGAGPHSIQPGSALPTISDPVIVDGATEPDFVAAPVIELDGSLAGAGTIGLVIAAGGSTIRGLVINRFNSSAIQLRDLGGNTIAGNYIGPDVTGAVGGVGNYVEGIYIYQSPNNMIGGTDPADRNIISGNRLRGIWINEVDDGPGASSSGTQILGNYIGTNAAGTDRLPFSGGASPLYQQIGVALWDAIGNSIGGTALGAGNVLSGHSWYGVYLWGPNSDANVIQGNIVGLDASAASPVGNGWEGAVRSGIYISNAPGNTIGGTAAGAGNIIAGNESSGIIIQGSSATGNAILSNAIHDNAMLGIDLGTADGVTPNDPDDSDTGGNNWQNFPVLSSAVTDEATTITIAGQLVSTPSTTFRLEFFANAAADPTGYGEGEIYLGSADVSTDATGQTTFNMPLSANVTVGTEISATATDPGNNTSEFSLTETAALPGHDISGIVFEDADFDGIATDWDGGASDVGQPGVEVELYDNTDVHIVSTVTDVGGNYSFTGLADGTYKVRVRSVTLGDSDSPPAGGFNATVPGTWPYPLPEMSWANTAPHIGGQDPDVDDTVTNNDAGPGDTYVPVTVSGIDVSGVNFGFSYELIVNELDDGLGDTLRSQQGSLRQFIKNANAISGTNRSQFQIPGL